MFISCLTIGGVCGKMKKCYNCGEEAVYWVGDNETDSYYEVVYCCKNCGVEIVVYKELEEEDAH